MFGGGALPNSPVGPKESHVPKSTGSINSRPIQVGKGEEVGPVFLL